MKKTIMSMLVMAMSLMAAMMMFVPGAYAQPSQDASIGAWSLDVSSLPRAMGNEPVITIEGKITKIEKMPGVRDGLQVRIKTDDNAKYLVLLGPRAFLKNEVTMKNMNPKVGDTIEARGKSAERIMVASEISIGDFTLKLRDETDGMPVWSARPRGK
jgi:hypothetical protein